MHTTTLGQVKRWLGARHPSEIIYFDALDPRHGLMNTYFAQVEGREHMLVAYDHAKQEQSNFVSVFDAPLIQMLYCIQHTPLRFAPMSMQVLQYIDTEEWAYQPKVIHEPFFELPPERHNALYDGPLRPEDVSWERDETITYKDKVYPIRIKVMAPTATYKPDYQKSLPYDFVITASLKDEPDFKWLRARHFHHDGNVGESAYDTEFFSTQMTVHGISSLGEGEHVELFTWVRNDISIATWKSQNGKLIRDTSRRRV